MSDLIQFFRLFFSAVASFLATPPIFYLFGICIGCTVLSTVFEIILYNNKK